MRIAVYPGSFDPITLGHLDIINRSRAVADRLVVGILANPKKQTLFSMEERVAQVRKAVAGMKHVQVRPFDGLLVNFAKHVSADVIIRGLRAMSDFEYEFQMSLMNRRLRPEAETVFLISAEPWTYLSSSAIKEIVKFGGSVKGLVTPHVEEELRRKYKDGHDFHQLS